MSWDSQIRGGLSPAAATLRRPQAHATSHTACAPLHAPSPIRISPFAGVRNAQARNIMKGMRPGERALFYHSSCKVPGVVGVVQVGLGCGTRARAAAQQQ